MGCQYDWWGFNSSSGLLEEMDVVDLGRMLEIIGIILQTHTCIIEI